jgi:hypothetical protein
VGAVPRNRSHVTSVVLVPGGAVEPVEHVRAVWAAVGDVRVVEVVGRVAAHSEPFHDPA